MTEIIFEDFSTDRLSRIPWRAKVCDLSRNTSSWLFFAMNLHQNDFVVSLLYSLDELYNEFKWVNLYGDWPSKKKHIHDVMTSNFVIIDRVLDILSFGDICILIQTIYDKSNRMNDCHVVIDMAMFLIERIVSSDIFIRQAKENESNWSLSSKKLIENIIEILYEFWMNWNIAVIKSELNLVN